MLLQRKPNDIEHVLDITFIDAIGDSILSLDTKTNLLKKCRWKQKYQQNVVSCGQNDISCEFGQMVCMPTKDDEMCREQVQAHANEGG